MSTLGSNINFNQTAPHGDVNSALSINGARSSTPRARSPNIRPDTSQLSNTTVEGDSALEEEPTVTLFKGLFTQSESLLDGLFNDKEGRDVQDRINGSDQDARQDARIDGEPDKATAALPKKPVRNIDEDDYDDSDEDDGDTVADDSPLKAKSAAMAIAPQASSQFKPLPTPQSPKPATGLPPSSQLQTKTSEDVRRRLEEDKQAAEDAARQSFHTVFYTIEYDRDAMLEQQKLEEADRQVDAEMSGNGGPTSSIGNSVTGNAQQGSLAQANLGASSLTLKHLIARIDAKREKVQASDHELRNLMSEVRKNRSKWASEVKVGQEELYEAAEKVLSELKAMTEHSHPFLARVNKREAPDYYSLIKSPMDLGTMTKKLKAVQYKSKQEFVEDLNLIWANCLRYNANPEHFLRKHALFMRKETEKLVPLIPDIVIRDRADVEEEERKLHAAEGDLEGGEDSDDEPIISSRGRKAPSKKSKKGASSTARKAPTVQEGTPGVDTKPMVHNFSSTGKNDFLKADSDTLMEGSQNGLSTPPPGTLTPAGINGISSSVAPGSQADPMDIDGMGASMNGVGPLNGRDEAEQESFEVKTWKQVTKKDRAIVAATRHRLFKDNKLNPDEPALLRSKAGMRRWIRQQKEAETAGVLGKRKREDNAPKAEEDGPSGETLAEGMEGEEERVLPDYYDTLAAIPELERSLQWIEDSEGHAAPADGKYLRIAPKKIFVCPESTLTKKIDNNMKQMQETRKVCTKIGVVKQMQLQSQMYQNQFQKYDPEPFVEQDIEAHVVSDDGPVMAPWVARAALQRSVGKIFYHAGFEEVQPSALEAVTDLAADFFDKIGRTLAGYMQAPKKPSTVKSTATAPQHVEWKPKYTTEETLLHCLQENGMDVEALESYVKDDVDRLSSKLATMYDRMKAHLADLLRPALNDAGPDGSNAFNDGSEQFVGGDFAEDLDEDFFGFKELGLDKEFGLASLSVPLHLLQNRMHNAYQAQNPSAISTLPSTLPAPVPYPAISIQTLPSEIGLIQNFFLAKLHANNNEPLVEDEDLPQKQRFPKPRLPPTGKISSPRKKPMKEPGPGKGHPRKKMKLNAEGGTGDEGNGNGHGANGGPVLMNGISPKQGGKDASTSNGDPEKTINAATIKSSGKPIPKPKLGTSTSTNPDMSRERSESLDGEGDIVVETPVRNKDTAAKDVIGKKTLVNGVNGMGSSEGGMISPESLVAT